MDQTQALTSLFIWMAVGGYFLGRRKGQGLRYALLSLPVSFSVLVLIHAVLG